MNLAVAAVLALIYVLSEAGLAVGRRAKKADSSVQDQGSLGLIWIVISASVTLAFSCAQRYPAAGMGDFAALRIVGIGSFVLGLALRWYSIIYLGRFFTVNVAIASDHRLIDTGPYRFVRHPSYSGALMAFLGLALCLGNWASLVLIVVPVLLVFLRRMQVEEAALLRAFGDRYRDYMRRTKRMIPAIY
ncbi:MAG TPA: isoprenylcysteine carboxylmethyltransferase family protein [Steroidobacteraceae bacterium]|jgi:protein-S-isoprenylcysteine O-methyltransferase